MPRRDYERFCELYNEKKNNPDYYFYSIHNQPDLYVSSGKLVNTKTVMEEPVDNSTVKIGVYLDIFPLDTLGNTRKEAEQLTEEALKLRKQLDVQNWKVIPERKWYLNVIIFLIKAFSPKGKRKKLIHEQDQLCRRYETSDLGTYVGYPCAAMKIELLEGQWFHETLLQPFEQYEFRIPKDYDKVLSVFYGPNYMELPPADKQKTHHVYHVWYRD
jgi:lipopolysaccharide cholinephosphotransferase